MHTITIFGKPVPTQRHGFDFTNKRAYTPPKTREAMRRRIAMIQKYMLMNRVKILKEVPLKVSLTFYHPRPKKWSTKLLRQMAQEYGSQPIPKTTKADVDNLAKMMLDCATQAGLWGDDCLITDMVVFDRYVGLDETGNQLSPKTEMIVQTLTFGKK